MSTIFVLCGCSKVVHKINKEGEEDVYVGGGLCEHCVEPDKHGLNGDYHSSPHWKDPVRVVVEERSFEEKAKGSIKVRGDSATVSKKKRRRKR